MDKFFKESIKNLIGSYKISEAIELLKKNISSTNLTLINEIITIQSKHSILQSSLRKGVEDYTRIMPDLISISDSLLSIVDSIDAIENYSDTQDKNFEYIPELKWNNWRGGHFSEYPKPIIKTLEELESQYFFQLKRLKNSVESFLEKQVDESEDLIKFLNQILLYIDQFIPDEIKGKLLSELDLVYIYVICCRSIEIYMFEVNNKFSINLRDEFEQIFNANSQIVDDTNRIVKAIIEEKDTVSHNTIILEERKLDFILSCCRFILSLVRHLYLSPEKRYLDLVPYNKFSKEEISSDNFNITKIDLNYNIHEVSIYAVCNSEIIHQVLATLVDDLNQLLNKLNYSLDQFFLSILRVKLYVNNSGYNGAHYEFRTQINTVISMFMGEELYGDKNVFLRELIQNARDAVMTRQIYEDSHGKNYTPKIEIIYDSQKNELICRDNGIGMNRNVINKYLSDIGRSFYNSEDYSKIIAGKIKEISSPISRFGIGLLSCFLVSDKLIIKTKRINETTGFKIDIPSRGAFFFLQEDNKIDEFGTEIKLSLKEDFIGWNKSSSKVLILNIDYGIKVKIEDKFVKYKGDKKLKRFFIENGKWKLVRAIAYYAINMNLPLYVTEDSLKYIIPPKRQIERIKETSGKTVLKFESDFLNIIISNEGNTFSVDENRNKICTSGGILVPKIKDFNIKQLNLPDWDFYALEISPSRVRMNLARDTMLDYRLSDDELKQIWETIKDGLIDFLYNLKFTFKEYYSGSSKFFSEIRRIPNNGGIFSKIINDKFYLILFKFHEGKVFIKNKTISQLDDNREQFKYLGEKSRVFYKIDNEWITFSKEYNISASLLSVKLNVVNTDRAILDRKRFRRLKRSSSNDTEITNSHKEQMNKLKEQCKEICKMIFIKSRNQEEEVLLVEDEELLNLISDYNNTVDELVFPVNF